MPFTDADIIQANGGSATDNTNPPTGNATLPNPVSPGNTVLLFTMTGLGAGVVAPDAFVRDFETGVGYLRTTYRQSAANGQSSWALSIPTAGYFLWIAVEVVDVAPLYQTAANPDTSNQTVTTWASGTTGTWTATDGLFFAFHMLADQATASASWSGWTNGYGLVFQQEYNPTGNQEQCIALSRAYPSDGSAQSTTATRSPSGSATLAAHIIGYQRGTILDPRAVSAVQVG